MPSCSVTALDRFVIFVSIGVPTAAKGTGVLFEISATAQAATGGKPSPTSRGAASAAGVPYPAAPSINAPNIYAMMIAWILGSGVIFWKPSLMTCMIPVCLSVLSSRIAPLMMSSRSSDFNAP